MEIKNKLTVIIGEGVGDNRRKKGKGHKGTCIRDTWTKPKGVRIEGGRQGMDGVGSGGGKWRQLYLNKNFKNSINKKKGKNKIK